MTRRSALAVAPVALVSDSCSRANSSTSAGSTDAYLGGPSVAWTAWGGAVFGISSNQLYLPTAVSDGYLTVDVGSTSMDVKAKFPTRPNANNVGLVAGFVDTNNFILFQINSTGVAQFYRRTAGSFNAITGSATTPIPSVAAGDTIGIRIEPMGTTQDGAYVTFSVNGVAVLQAALASQTIGTKAGFREDGASTWRASNFRAMPLVARPTLARRSSAVLTPAGLEAECLNPDVSFIDGQWVMCYSADTGSGLGTSLAYSSDLVTWTKEPNNPILTPLAGEHLYATNGSIVKLGSTYYCYYQAVDNASATNTYVATASALSGPWTRQGQVLANVSDPMARVLPDGVTIELWYLGGTFIGKATSTNGTTFTNVGQKYIPPSSFTGSGSWGEPFVFTDSTGRLHLFWCGATTNGYRSIHEAVSSDNGVTWADRQYRLRKGPAGQFDAVQVFDPSPVVVGSTLYLFYAGAPLSGAGGGLTGSAIGLAIGPAW